MDFEDRKSSKDMIDNATMNDDEVVASYGPSRSFFLRYLVQEFKSARIGAVFVPFVQDNLHGIFAY